MHVQSAYIRNLDISYTRGAQLAASERVKTRGTGCARYSSTPTNHPAGSKNKKYYETLFYYNDAHDTKI